MTKQDKQLTESQRNILKVMLEWGQYSHGYDWLEDDTGLDRKMLKVDIKALRDMGLVMLHRGGLNDDGEIVGGTGFYVPYTLKMGVRALLGKEVNNED